jgi:hypothetical protein
MRGEERREAEAAEEDALITKECKQWMLSRTEGVCMLSRREQGDERKWTGESVTVVRVLDSAARSRDSCVCVCLEQSHCSCYALSTTPII